MSATRVASSDGVTVVVHDLGGQGPPLLLCHATGFHGQVWQPVADLLANRFHCLAPDLRGHGDSEVDVDHAFDWGGFADDVLAVVDALRLEGCVAAGHSKGGASLLLAEQRRPGTFGALYCYEPVVFPPEARAALARIADDNPLAASARRRRPSFSSRQEAAANYASKPPLDVFTPEALAAYVEHGFADDDGAVRLKCRPEVEAAVYQMAAHHGAFDDLGTIGCPVTVATGRVESYQPSSMAARVAGACPSGRLVEHPELGHFGPMEAPDVVAADLVASLTTP